MADELLVATRLSGDLLKRWEKYTDKLDKKGTNPGNSDLLRLAVDVFLLEKEAENGKS